ncbi:glycosyltransferase [Streptomonospora nanhaiensis]|uniref:Glycosyltransferase n=1 Tax=Streptomonospora nanhaiensis TaxID=1323731 RepID=A0ABY6YF47_9ACTN|nr:glycosyltransferase [Streptomonospora nanhaiensis]WAE70856.1 glycosyltransferase [Streptomonospora nanhaiensis]
MRILFTTLPVETHLRPLVAVAETALARGHDVAVCAPESFRDEVDHYGLPFLPAGKDWITGMLAPLFDSERIPPEQVDALMRRLVSEGLPGDGALATARDVLGHIREGGADAVVREAYDMGGYLAAEAAGIAHASVGVVGRVTEFLAPDRLAQPLDEHRAQLGLPPDPRAERLYAHLHAHLMPPGYDPAETAIPTLRCYRHRTVDRPGDRLPPLLGGLDHSLPLVYASLGTVAPLFRAADTRLRSIVDGLGEVACEAVVAVGRGRAQDLGRSAPPNVRVVDFVAQPLLLDTADLLVTHAGFTSVREALRAGLPMVAIPWIAENHLVATRCEELGLARRLDWEHLDAGRVADACREVLGDPSFRARARGVQRDMLALPSLDTLVTDIEELAAGAAR